ncbi:MAG: hypothetical protein IH881_11965 [Myxococcales bacterium]|nr:hypothetical protein [Myxococcales bacterium]
MDSLLLLRAFGGLMQQLATLKIALPWREMLEERVPEALRMQAANFEPPPLPAAIQAKIDGRDARPLARSLIVQVLDGGKQKVKLIFPAEVALDLESIVPDDVREMIREENIDLTGLIDQVRDTGIAPQALIQLERPPKTYRVWLE